MSPRGAGPTSSLPTGWRFSWTPIITLCGENDVNCGIFALFAKS